MAWAFYTWIGVARYSRGEYGNYDLGIFVQAAHSWLTLGRPYSDIKGINLLGDHFSPITVLFALAYQMWADPRALIVAQSLALALVVAISTWSVARAGARSVKVGGVALVALLALPQVSAAGFQVHETALGAPFVLLLAMSVVTGARRPALVLALAVLTIKEDAGLMVAGAGAAWFLIHRERRMAAGLAGLGAVGFIVSNAVILWVNPGHQNPYLRYFTSGDTSGGGLTLEEIGPRLVPFVLYALLAGLRWSPLHLMALPGLAWRAVSSNELYWSVHLHYDVITAPVALTVLICAIGPSRSQRVGRRILIAAMALSVLWGASRVVSSQTPWTWRGGMSPHQVAAEQLAREVPSGTVIVADQYLGPTLVDSHSVRMLSQTHDATGRFVLLQPERDTLAAPSCAKRLFIADHDVVGRRADVVLVDLGEPRRFRLPACHEEAERRAAEPRQGTRMTLPVVWRPSSAR